ncbi:hypothetical protein SAMN05660816_06586 [Niastella yeongjuensis]|nr:hypothetical protein SAMN05660816_06586 [Niastella yeongjuensis]
MALQDEIEKRTKQIHTDGYVLSIGELMSLYKDKEIDIILNSNDFLDGHLIKKPN